MVDIKIINDKILKNIFHYCLPGLSLDQFITFNNRVRNYSCVYFSYENFSFRKLDDVVVKLCERHSGYLGMPGIVIKVYSTNNLMKRSFGIVPETQDSFSYDHIRFIETHTLNNYLNHFEREKLIHQVFEKNLEGFYSLWKFNL